MASRGRPVTNSPPLSRGSYIVAEWRKQQRKAEDTDYEQARRSLDRLKDLGEVTMLPGHGRPWKGNIKDAIAMALGL